MLEHTVSVDGERTPEVLRAAERFSLESRSSDAGSWELRFESAAHSLAFFSVPETAALSPRRRATDARGWEDWRDAGPDRYEATAGLLPPPAPAPETSDIRIWRFEDIWVWDERGPAMPASTLAAFGIQRVRPAGGWIWKAVKLGWKYAPHAGRVMRDPRVVAAMWLAQRGWHHVAEQARRDQARMSRVEAEQRILVAIARERQQRLDSGDDAQRRKWRTYYNDLDALIAINS